MTRTTISLPENLLETFRERAAYNRRSVSAEITFTLEAALAMESDVNLGLMRALMKAPEEPQTE